MARCARRQLDACTLKVRCTSGALFWLIWVCGAQGVVRGRSPGRGGNSKLMACLHTSIFKGTLHGAHDVIFQHLAAWLASGGASHHMQG